MFFFFIIHHLFSLIFDTSMSDVRRNCLTLVVGSICYFLLYGYVTANYSTGNWLFRALRDWYGLLIVIDIFSVGIIYRSYYGRSIVNEIGDDQCGKWDYEPETHQYHKSDIAVKEEYFADKLDTLDQAETTLNQLEDQVEQFQETNQKLEKIDQIEENLQELDMAIRYAPGGDLALAAQADFEALADQQQRQVNEEESASTGDSA